MTSTNRNPPPESSASEDWWTWRRATAVKGIAAAVVSFPVVVWVMFHAWPVDYADLDQTGRLMLALRWLPVPALFLFFMFTRTARLFDTKGAEEVLAGLESDRWRRNAKIYQNSVEQLLFFAPMYLALATAVRPDEAQIIPVLACLWLFGRVSFFAAYHIDPAYRAFGFDYTLFPGLLAGMWFAARTIGG